MGTVVLSVRDGRDRRGADRRRSLAGDGSALSARLLLGVLFLAAGVGRLYLESQAGPGGMSDARGRGAGSRSEAQQ